MRSQPIVPYTVSEQIDELCRMAPELAEMGAHRSLYAMARNLQAIAKEEGFNLRIVEVDSTPTPNPLAPVLAQERANHRVLRLNVARGLTLSLIPLMACSYRSASRGDWFSATVCGFLAVASVLTIHRLQRSIESEVR